MLHSGHVIVGALNHYIVNPIIFIICKSKRKPILKCPISLGWGSRGQEHTETLASRMRCNSQNAQTLRFVFCAPKIVRVAPLQNKIAPKCCNSKTLGEMKSSKNTPKRPRKCFSPVQLPKNFSPALFHSFAPKISNIISNAV